MNDIIKSWRDTSIGTVLAWASSIFIAASMGVTLFGAAVSYVVSVSANEIFDGMLLDRGISKQSFKDLQNAATELKEDVGSMKASLNGINNTLTINATRSEQAEEDRKELKEQVKKLVNKLIQE